MSNESPFFLSKVECPICKTINEFETIKVGSFMEGGRDSDFCPKDITWKYPKYQSYNPLIYFTAVCDNCYYTREFNSSFKDWKNDNTFRSYRLKPVKEKHLEQLSQADSVMKVLGESINVSGFPIESAIIKLHLAIMDEQLNDHSSNLDLGRFYLRIGWLFRDFGKEENPNQKFVKRILLELDNSFNDFKNSLHGTSENLAIYARHLNSHFESPDISSEIKTMMVPFKEKFSDKLKTVQSSLQDYKDSVDSLNSISDEYHDSALLCAGAASSGAGFGNANSFYDFTSKLQDVNTSIVTDEKEALEKSVSFYKAAFASGREITPGNQQIQASYLIAELSRRIGDYESAKEYFNSTIKYGQDFIYKNRNDRSRIALARKILELAIEQGKENMAALKAGE